MGDAENCGTQIRKGSGRKLLEIVVIPIAKTRFALKIAGSLVLVGLNQQFSPRA